MRKVAVVAAGGTGGHLFPAQALAEALIARGWRIVLASDERVAGLAQDFPAEHRIGLSAATYKPGDPIGMLRAGLAVFRGASQARAAYRQIGPNVVVGFGGYPSAPALVGAILDRRPTVIHEQNAVMGRANRMLASHVQTVACAFPTLQKAPPKVAGRAIVVGNPVRPPIRALADLPYTPPEPDGPIRLLVTGGSQGARLLSELVPEAIRTLPEGLRQRLIVQQQTRAESMNNARRVYRDALVDAEIAPFFRDIAGRLAAAHLVIGRAGAGTVCEFAVAGKPSILVPLAIAIDDDQGQNAKLLADAGGAEIAREHQLTVDSLSGALEKLLSNPARLARMAAAARSVAIPDAAERLADVVERTARA
ncbi:undecaprenyldiphospho-muramoylpentapeptide beta-N-acetylglucosaminyltransferase [Phenylobacterium hankyongense]|uniref:UDP-N-acetylglucosamine--N-acetylmuramyl-(pentapeptide) pyrophosphoryl-undecaprenol N-acetylglucosamine transferase n=1 Tax=Phenylobacterium hankyongense TaxID=1813876 RepID=A0A328B419_9CAUL|nr:undecaprenyldiphospho-muramoylpentapeptide beta-N-acetylglucosaminyltransferase [Phenylobacterium hankyongense]RAK60594.1 undecaprenyldiphospho-muramoylpentapeptide beta-N-acetylglucosaminyltransferase [Phenylobacterium hankyongense]